jgi:drug/metabolite transporter (DMT)-like permease
VLPALLTTTLFALSAICATQAAATRGPAYANLGRLLLATVILGLVSLVFLPGNSQSQLPLFALGGALGFGLGGFAMMHALTRLGSTLALLTNECAAALLTTVLAWITLSATLGWMEVLALVAILGGILLALLPLVRGQNEKSPLPPQMLLSGLLLAAVAASLQASSWILSKHAFTAFISEGIEFHPLHAAFQRLVGGLAAAVLLFLFLRHQFPAARPISRKTPQFPHLWILANALAGPVLGVSAMLWAIRETANPGLVQTVVATATLVSVPLAKRLELRQLSLHYFAGALLALSGIVGLFVLQRG